MRKIFSIASLALAVISNASAGAFSGVPTGWRIESYGTTRVTLWFTPSTCNNGYLQLPTGATVTDHNRLYATVMAAKTANIPMFIFYDLRDNTCVITSYGLD